MTSGTNLTVRFGRSLSFTHTPFFTVTYPLDDAVNSTFISGSAVALSVMVVVADADVCPAGIVITLTDGEKRSVAVLLISTRRSSSSTWVVETVSTTSSPSVYVTLSVVRPKVYLSLSLTSTTIVTSSYSSFVTRRLVRYPGLTSLLSGTLT